MRFVAPFSHLTKSDSPHRWRYHSGMTTPLGISFSAAPRKDTPLHRTSTISPVAGGPEHEARDRFATLIRYAIDRDVRVIDTDWITHGGHAQEAIGLALEGVPRDQYRIISKGGPRLTFHGDLTIENSRANLLNQLQDSLFRLKLNRVDWFQVHWPDASDPTQTARGLADAVHAGGASSVGACFGARAWLQSLHGVEALNAVTLALHPLASDDALNALNWATENNVTVFAGDPFLDGAFTGRFTGQEEFPSDEGLFDAETFPRVVRFVAAFAGWASARDMTPVQAACVWAWSLGATTVLVPVNEPSELDPLLTVTDRRFDADEMAAINDLRATHGFAD